jgi:hypothetical protein
MKTPIPKADPIARAASTLDEFCASHGLSKPMLYKLWKQGIGPKFMIIGSRRLISAESAAAWREGLERQSEHDALPEIERRSQRASALVRTRRDRQPKPKPRARASADATA